jgi:hypothetical protein
MAVDQIIIRFSEQGMAQLSASIDVLHTKIQGLGTIATKMSTRMPLGAYGLTSGITSETRSDVLALASQMLETAKMNKSLLGLHKTTQLFGREMGLQWQMSQLAKNAQAANTPLFQMSRNAARLAEVANPLRNNLAQLGLTVGAMAIDLKDTNLEGERFARMAMAAQTPVGQLAANAAKLRQLRTPAALMMPSPGVQLGVSATGAAGKSMTGLSAQENLLATLEQRLRVFQGLARQPIGSGAAGLAVQANLQNAISATEARIGSLRARMAEVTASTSTWSKSIAVAASSLRNIGSTVEHVIGRVSYFGFVFAGLSYSLFEATKRLGEFGAKMIVTGQQFETSSSAMGTMSSSLLPQLEAASLGTISKFELMRMSNAALTSGLKVTDGQMLQLVDGATKLGIVMGRDTAEAFQRLVFGITKGERRLLDELGIILQSKDAFAAYADSIGEATNELDRSQKVQAFLSFVLDAINTKTKTFSNVNWGLAASVLQINKVVTDFVSELGKVFVESGAAARLVDILKSSLSGLMDRMKGDEGAQFFNKIVDSIAKLIPMMTMLAQGLLLVAENATKLVGVFAGLQIGKLAAGLLPLLSLLVPGGAAVSGGMKLLQGALPVIGAIGGAAYLSTKEIGAATTSAMQEPLQQLYTETRRAADTVVRNILIQGASAPGIA